MISNGNISQSLDCCLLVIALKLRIPKIREDFSIIFFVLVIQCLLKVSYIRCYLSDSMIKNFELLRYMSLKFESVRRLDLSKLISTLPAQLIKVYHEMTSYFGYLHFTTRNNVLKLWTLPVRMIYKSLIVFEHD